MQNNSYFEKARATSLKLLTYCQSNDWAGYDPYDALNSRLFEALPVVDSRLSRLVLTQALKRSPINIRRFLLVPKTQNPKALALFLMALLNFARTGRVDREELIQQLVDRLILLRSPHALYWCWGYSFSWQTRTIVVPRGAPNLVCTTFVANALLEVYEQCQDSRCLDMALSAAEYIVNELYWTDGGARASFSYPQPAVRSETHNANLLAAAMLCRLHKHTKREEFLLAALRVARYSVSKQHADGSWNYGEGRSQQWIDNFHTGYNLCALRSICRYAETREFEPCLRQGFEFYRAHFFREQGAVKYFHDRCYPIDIHCVAQSIITLIELKELDPENVALACSVFQWAMTHMWDERGFFYYRVLRFCTIRTSYMRWSQAWMLLAMSMLISETGVAKPQGHDSRLARA